MSELITVPHDFTPRSYQLKLFQAMDGVIGQPNTAKKSALLVWPRQIGKDTSCWAYMIRKAVEVPGNYFYIFPTKEQARRALWEKILQDGTGRQLLSLLPLEEKYGIVIRRSNMEMLIELYNHSTIRVLGLDTNPDAIKGISPKGVVFSEFAFADHEAYKAVLPALRNEGCWKIINSTPNGRNHFYDMFMGVQNRDDWYVSYLQALYPEKPNYIHVAEPEYFKQLVDEGSMTWDDIEREYGCSFSTGLKGSYYADHIEEAWSQGRVGHYAYNPRKRVYTYWDIGIDDSTSVWFVQYDGQAIVFIDYFEDSGKGIDFYVNMLLDKNYKYGTHFLPHDAGHRKQGRTISTTAEDFADSLNDMGLSDDVQVLEKVSVQEGINAVRKRFNRYFFNVDTTHVGLKKIELYHKKYDKRKQTFAQEPVHDLNSHAADALRQEALAEDLNPGTFHPVYDKPKIISNYDPFG